MRRNIIETIMGAVVLLVAIFFVTFVFQSSGVKTVEGYQVVASFDDASGLAAGTEVRMAGVKIGTVQANELDTETFMAKVTMNIQDGIEMPTDTSARIIPDGLLGGNFIALEPGGDEDVLKNGSVISFTQGSINVADGEKPTPYTAIDQSDNNGSVKWVQKFDADGEFLASWETGGDLNFQGTPEGLAVDEQGRVYVTD